MSLWLLILLNEETRTGNCCLLLKYLLFHPKIGREILSFFIFASFSKEKREGGIKLVGYNVLVISRDFN